jgi:hypothetical protein
MEENKEAVLTVSVSGLDDDQIAHLISEINKYVGRCEEEGDGWVDYVYFNEIMTGLSSYFKKGAIFL